MSARTVNAEASAMKKKQVNAYLRIFKFDLTDNYDRQTNLRQQLFLNDIPVIQIIPFASISNLF